MHHARLVSRPLLVLPLLIVMVLAPCGDDPSNARPRTTPSDSTAATGAATDETPATEASPEPATAAVSELLGEKTLFVPGGSGATDLDTAVKGRECVLAEALPLTCRASTGAGGAFVVTVEGVADAPGDFNVVVRCGLTPAAPSASASGPFQPITTDLGLAEYGEVAGITLRGADTAEAALVYLSADAECPIVWSLGEISRDSIFTGGTDALNGSEAPIRFLDAAGVDACAVADGQGGITVGTPRGDACR